MAARLEAKKLATMSWADPCNPVGDITAYELASALKECGEPKATALATGGSLIQKYKLNADTIPGQADPVQGPLYPN